MEKSSELIPLQLNSRNRADELTFLTKFERDKCYFSPITRLAIYFSLIIDLIIIGLMF